MRELVADLLHRLANHIHNTDHDELFEARDEYGICRFRIVVHGDDLHGIKTAFELLPEGWIIIGEPT